MLTSEQIELLDIAWKFNMSIFSIAVTLFTVLLSFIISKKDELKLLVDLNKHNSLDGLTNGRIVNVRGYILRLRYMCYHVLAIAFTSIILFITELVIKFLSITLWQYIVILILSAIIFLYAIILLIILSRFFLRYSKV